MPVTTFCLGVWQIKRREQKLELIQKLVDKTVSDPIPLPSKYVLFIIQPASGEIICYVVKWQIQMYLKTISYSTVFPKD